MPEPTSTSFIATGIAAKKLVESVITDLYGLAKTEAGFQLKKWRAARHADTVSKRVRELRLVKTIWQIEKEIDLTDFYFPSKVYVGKSRVSVHQLADLGYEGNIILEGTVGQGKSILLRYLAATDFCLNRRIPIFIELRRLRQGQSLEDIALQELKALGFEMTAEVFDFFAKKGRLLLLLDAFDEAKDELRQDLVANIERLIRQYEALTVVVTSRPDSGISASPFLRVFRMSQLEGNEYEEVIRKMAHDSKTSDAIISGIRKDSSQVAALLRTPLMVALLMVRYRIDQSLPQNSAAFYESLFSLLLQRHDKSKGGYVRPRKSGASDSMLQDFFNALCFVSRKARETSFTQAQLKIHAREALSVVGERADVDKLLDDVIEITCLIIRDGEEARFIHKSVQEYHAALFIKGQPDMSATRFYDAMAKSWSSWEQELRFLRQIDRFRFFKNFGIPALRRKFGAAGGAIGEPADCSLEVASRLFGEDCLRFDPNSNGSRSLTVGSSMKHWPLQCSLGGSPYLKAVFAITRKDVSDDLIVKESASDNVFVKDLLRSEKAGAKVLDGCSKLYSILHKELKEAEDYVRHVEETTALFDFTSPPKPVRQKD